MKHKLTDTIIKKALMTSTNASKSSIHGCLIPLNATLRDTELKGLYIKRTGIETIAWCYAYSFNRKRRVMTLGYYPALSLANIRTLYQQAASKVYSGTDPLDEKLAAATTVEPDAPESVPTIGAFLNNEYTVYKQSSAQHPEQIIRNITIHFHDLLDIPITDVSPAMLQGWLADQQRLNDKGIPGYSSGSISKRYKAFKTLFNYAVRQSVINTSPFDKLDKLNLQHQPHDHTKRTYLSQQQAARLITAIDAYDLRKRHQRANSNNHGKHLPDLSELPHASYHRPMILMLFYTGMRPGDLFNLDWRMIRLADTNPAIVKVLNKTSRKVSTSTVIPLSPQCVEVLKGWHLQHGNPTSGLVFKGATGKALSTTCLRSAWSRIKTDAGLPQTLQLYTLRHNFISHLVMQSVPLKVIASIVGHQTTAMIEKHYCHLMPDVGSSAVNGFASMLNA